MVRNMIPSLTCTHLGFWCGKLLISLIVHREIISGQIPYKDYSKEKFAEVCRDPDSQLPELDNKAHPKLVSLVKKCMHKHPGSRPAFKNLLNEIQQLKTGINNNSRVFSIINFRNYDQGAQHVLWPDPNKDRKKFELIWIFQEIWYLALQVASWLFLLF